MRGLVVVTTFMLGLAAAGRAAHADPASQQRADALFAEGRKRIEAHDNAGACAKFNEAIKLDPDAAGTMLNLGLCNQNLKKYRLALYWFRKAQARAHETNLPEYETAAGQRTRDIVELVALVSIELAATTPADAHVKIDGEEISPSDYRHVEIDAGHHTLEARAPDHKAMRQEFDVVGKGGNTLTVELVPGEDSVVLDPGAGRKKVAIITAIGGGALLVTSGVVSLVAWNHYNDIVDKNGLHPGQPCPADKTAQCSSANHQQTIARWVATPIFAVGAAAVGVATYLYLTAPSKERVDQTALVPTVTPDGFGIAAVGRF